jgi:hypothetical protein
MATSAAAVIRPLRRVEYDQLVPERCIEVYTSPSPGAYAHVARYERGSSIRPLAFSDVSFAVSEILK